MNENDPVNHPAHYTSGKIEVADFIADKELDFFLGNVVKYVARAGRKVVEKTVEDLEKARWYLNRKIVMLGGKDWSGDTPSDEIVMLRQILASADSDLIKGNLNTPHDVAGLLDDFGKVLDMR